MKKVILISFDKNMLEKLFIYLSDLKIYSKSGSLEMARLGDVHILNLYICTRN